MLKLLKNKQNVFMKSSVIMSIKEDCIKQNCFYLNIRIHKIEHNVRKEIIIKKIDYIKDTKKYIKYIDYLSL